MKISRNTKMIFGCLLLLLGLEFFSVQKATLTPAVGEFLGRLTKNEKAAPGNVLEQVTGITAEQGPLVLSIPKNLCYGFWAAGGFIFLLGYVSKE